MTATIQRLCEADGCTRVHMARGLCNVHYNRQRRFAAPGGPLPTRFADPSALERRMWKRIEITPEGCWQWTGSMADGYARVSVDDRYWLGHRLMYLLCRGPIRDGLELDHLCRNRACVNPDHLEPVTRRINQRRGNTVSGINARKTHCPSGHPYDEKNTRWTRNKRHCRACARERARRQYQAKRVLLDGGEGGR